MVQRVLIKVLVSTPGEALQEQVTLSTGKVDLEDLAREGSVLISILKTSSALLLEAAEHEEDHGNTLSSRRKSW